MNFTASLSSAQKFGSQTTVLQRLICIESEEHLAGHDFIFKQAVAFTAVHDTTEGCLEICILLAHSILPLQKVIHVLMSTLPHLDCVCSQGC